MLFRYEIHTSKPACRVPYKVIVWTARPPGQVANSDHDVRVGDAFAHSQDEAKREARAMAQKHYDQLNTSSLVEEGTFTIEPINAKKKWWRFW